MMKLMKGKKRTRKEKIRMALIVLFWLILWEIADRLIDNRIILVGPTHILIALADHLWGILFKNRSRIYLIFHRRFCTGSCLL